MIELRAVPLDEEQFRFLEDLGLDAMRAGEHERATKLLAIALAWKVAPKIRGGTNDAAGGTDGAPSPSVCTAATGGSVGERPSAPNNVVELDPWSRKVAG